MSYLDKITAYCKERDLSEAQFLRDAGVAGGSISKWRHGNNKPSMKSLQKIADHIGIEVEDLLRKTPADLDAQYEIPDNWSHEPDVVRDSALHYIPVFRYVGYDSDEPDPASIIGHLPAFPDSVEDPDMCFGLVIDDSAMSPEIEAGDVVIVRKDPEPASGDIVIACEAGGTPVCRRLIRSGDDIILQPFNRHYTPSLYKTHEADMITLLFKGKVVAIVRKVMSSSNSVPE